jgi:hypothetical protein
MLPYNTKDVHYCENTWLCASLDVRFSNSGVSLDEYGNTVCWVPIIFQNPYIWFWFSFYIFLWVVIQVFAPSLVQYRKTKDETRNRQLQYKRSILSRYPTPWVHAVLAVLFSFLAVGVANDWFEAAGFTFWFAIMHSFGYFIADCVVDRDPVFFAHHLAPMVAVELMVRYECSFYHAVIFGLLCELGNIFAHASAMYNLGNHVYVRHFRWFYGLTRPLSIIPGLLILVCDIPEEYRWSIGTIVTILILSIYLSNFIAVVVAVRDQTLVVGGAAGIGNISVASVFAAHFGSSSEERRKKASVGPRLQAPVFAPYKPKATT